jgi:hypothetical protein
MECPSRSGATREAKRGDSGLESVDRKTSIRNRCHGRTTRQDKKVLQRGIEDTSNEMGAYMVVRADSHEAAAKLFEGHPHFTIFPGERVEIMPVLPIPGS